MTVVALFQKRWTPMSRTAGESPLDATYMQDAFIFSKVSTPDLGLTESPIQSAP